MKLKQALTTLRQQQPRGGVTARWLPLVLLGCVIALLAMFGLDTLDIRTRLLFTAGRIPACLYVGLVFGMLPVLMCLVQTVTRKRLQGKLESVQTFPVARTTYFVAAKSAVDAITPATLNLDYLVPFIVLFLLNAFGFGLIYSVFPNPASFEAPNLILGGMQTIDPQQTDLKAYQMGTFVMMSVAFVGAYIYTLGRLIDRLNNNDLYPIAIYFYVVRAIVAAIAAAVIRHSAAAMTVESTSALLLLAFITGLAPDLFLLAMARRAFQMMKVFGNKKDPDKAARPASLPLIMIDDITRDKVDRLSELGIDSAQVLACQNPFTIWMKLPYDLGLIVEWIAAAQLYTLVKEHSLQALRDVGVLNVFDLRYRFDTTEAAEQVCGLTRV